jgi:hypothetical protein
MTHLTQAGYTQIEKVKKVSAWGGHPVRPDLLGTAYGMNFARMPELAWPFGYPFALGLMLVVSPHPEHGVQGPRLAATRPRSVQLDVQANCSLYACLVREFEVPSFASFEG